MGTRPVRFAINQQSVRTHAAHCIIDCRIRISSDWNIWLTLIDRMSVPVFRCVVSPIPFDHVYPQLAMSCLSQLMNSFETLGNSKFRVSLLVLRNILPCRLMLQTRNCKAFEIEIRFGNWPDLQHLRCRMSLNDSSWFQINAAGCYWEWVT